MKDKAPSRLDWPAMVNGAIGRFTRLNVELLQKAAEPHAGSFVADADPNGAVFVMNTHGNHRPLEAGIGHSGHRKKQLARQETRLIHSFGNEPQLFLGQALRRAPSWL